MDPASGSRQGHDGRRLPPRARRRPETTRPTGAPSVRRRFPAARPRRPSRPGSAPVELGLPLDDPLCGPSLERRKLLLIMRRAKVLDLPRPPPRGVDDLDGPRSRGRLHRPYIRHRRRIRTRLVRQISRPRHAKQQASALWNDEPYNRGPSQVNCEEPVKTQVRDTPSRTRRAHRRAQFRCGSPERGVQDRHFCSPSFMTAGAAPQPGYRSDRPREPCSPLHLRHQRP